MSSLTRNPWLQFVIRRLLATGLILVALVFASFLMVHLVPGDPALAAIGIGGNRDQLIAVRHELGLDQPLGQQLLNYWMNLLHGNLGVSFATHVPVSEVIAQRAGYSINLALVSLVLVLVLSVPIGMVAGALTREGRHSYGEVAFTGITSIVSSVPEYLAGTFLAFVFAVVFRLLPVGGGEGWESLVLPTLAISLRPIAIIARIVRVETLNVLALDYMRTARSKRLPARVLYLRHALPNVLTAALTVGGLLFAGLIGGAVVVENVFARPGLGTALTNAVLARDYPLIQGIILVLGVMVVFVNAVVDLSLALVDPRSLTKDG